MRQHIHEMKRCLTTAFWAIIGVASLYADAPQLRFESPRKDTVTTTSVEVVGVTSPGSEVSVAGNKVHVYKTGTFAATVDLQSGDNAIKVEATGADGSRTERVLRCYRAAKPVVVSGDNTADEATMMFAEPRYVVTKEDAYLQYGNGDDRLGGSKMGFIDSGIKLKAIGAKGGLYCVRLSSTRVAYIPKRLTVEATAPMQTPVNTGSWSITNTGKTDEVTVSLPTRLPYQYTTEETPTAIVIDIFGATDNSNWITQRTLDLGVIDHTDFRQIDEDTYRVIIYLKDKHIWGYSVGYDKGNALRISVRHQPAELSLKGMTIGLDAGHGGENPGAISPSGILEKDVNLDIVLRVRELLHKRGARTVLTRDGDTGPSMSERKRIWREANVDLAVSVHNNAAGSYTVDGTAILYKHSFDRELAQCVTRRMLQTGLKLFGIVGNFNFSLNAVTFCPNILVEGMFMSSPEDEERLADADFRQQVALRIVQGIEDYLKLCR